MLKIQLWTPDTCGCSFHLAFDDGVPEHLLPGTEEAQPHQMKVIEANPHFVTHAEAIAIHERRREHEKEVWAATRKAHKNGGITTEAAFKRLGIRHSATGVELPFLAKTYLHELGPIQSNVNTKRQPEPVTCKHHAGLESPLHYEKANEEHILKNQAIAALEETVDTVRLNINGVETVIPNPQVLGIDYRPMWAFDSDRHLHVSHTHLNPTAPQHPAFARLNNLTLHLDHTEFDWAACKYRG